MKRKPAGSNHKAVTKYLSENGAATPAEIAKATKVKGNIYQIMNKMVSLGLVEKVGKVYITADSFVDDENTVKPQPGKFVPPPHPNAEKISLLLDEIDHVGAGIRTLEATLNYLNRRVEQLSEIVY
jgi:hypothetical protein